MELMMLCSTLSHTTVDAVLIFIEPFLYATCLYMSTLQTETLLLQSYLFCDIAKHNYFWTLAVYAYWNSVAY